MPRTFKEVGMEEFDSLVRHAHAVRGRQVGRTSIETFYFMGRVIAFQVWIGRPARSHTQYIML